MSGRRRWPHAPRPGDVALLIRWDGPRPAPAFLTRGGVTGPAGCGQTREAVDLKRLLKDLLRAHGFEAVAIHTYPRGDE